MERDKTRQFEEENDDERGSEDEDYDQNHDQDHDQNLDKDILINMIRIKNEDEEEEWEKKRNFGKERVPKNVIFRTLSQTVKTYFLVLNEILIDFGLYA